MRSSLILGLACALALAAGSAPAQQVVRPVQGLRPATASPVSPAAVVDRQQLLERRVMQLAKKNRALEGRVATLEAALRDMRAATEFSCATPTTSVNGRGVTDDCSPYACNYIDGRCRTTAATSNHCAPGFLMDGGRCVAPPPPAPDDDCFLDLFC
ncbi:hypothetical protein ACFOED_10770 [Vulcaniibacterium thermophilum]|uniref:Uncharacterized protein n=1 Tax=Vulcaniibacterium thermophilum TaxID=1169913 RepID=A0A918YX56_9GAMM|nr:hypothetical protein [Vulcaniibacterium thermophilum]GHE27415.1 hypothetical protein GCM10007167_06040 [Vulcaniibacterium thermophilum]